MRVLILGVISALALPFMAFGQGAEPQPAQAQANEPAKETQTTTAPAKGKSKPQEQTATKARPEAATDVHHGKNDVQTGGHAEGTTKDAAAGASSSTSETKTKVNVTEFRERHSEVFHLGRH